MALLGFAGCGGGGERSSGASRPAAGRPAAPPAAAAPAAPAGGAAMGSASVKGSVKFQGGAPQAARIRMDADPFCQKAHAGGGASSEEVVVNANGTLRYVFVYVKSGLSGSYPAPSEPVVIDQRGCTYHPHVLGMQAGQKIKILNSDDTLHNIHALPKNNAQFNIAMPKYVKEKEQTFTSPEVMVPIKCDVHSWMSTYVGVVNHPFFAVTDDDGSFSLGGLPAGTYTVEAWHEKYGTQTQQVTVADGQTSEISFTFAAA
jgi:plastocyanin